MRPNLEWKLSAARPQEQLADGPAPLPADLSAAAKEVAEALERRGASFFAELVASARRLPNEVEDGLWELLARGLVTADAVQNLRVLQSPKLKRRQRALQRGGPGRWSLLRPLERPDPEEMLEKAAKLFLRRYGIVFRELLARQTRRREKTGHVVHLSATDPLNLTGVVTPGPRIAAVMGHHVTYVDGIPQPRVVEDVEPREAVHD